MAYTRLQVQGSNWNTRNWIMYNLSTSTTQQVEVWTVMHLMMITQTREQVSVQVISTLALQVQLKHKELNYHLIMYNLSTILPTF